LVERFQRRRFKCDLLPILELLPFLAHLAFRPCELLPSLFVRPSTFQILIFSSETTGPIATKLWWNGAWMAHLICLICIIGINRPKEKFHTKTPIKF
jgi:hypothetical protein